MESQGASEASWVAITDNGDTVEVKKAALCDPSTPLPDLDAEIGENGMIMTSELFFV